MKIKESPLLRASSVLNIVFIVALLSVIITDLWLDWRPHGLVVAPGLFLDQEVGRNSVSGGFAYPTSAAYVFYSSEESSADHRRILNKLARDIGIPPVTGDLECRETSPFGDYTLRNAPIHCVEKSLKGVRYISFDSLKAPANLTVVAYTDFRREHLTVGVEDALQICSMAVFPNFPALIVAVAFFGLILVHLEEFRSARNSSEPESPTN